MARYTVDHSAGAHAVWVPCSVCGRVLRLSDSLIDVDGPAFQAHYHRECAPSGTSPEEHGSGCPWDCESP